MLGAIKISDVNAYKRVKEIEDEVWPKSKQTLPIACIHEALRRLDGEKLTKAKK